MRDSAQNASTNAYDLLHSSNDRDLQRSMVERSLWHLIGSTVVTRSYCIHLSDVGAYADDYLQRHCVSYLSYPPFRKRQPTSWLMYQFVVAA